MITLSQFSTSVMLLEFELKGEYKEETLKILHKNCDMVSNDDLKTALDELILRCNSLPKPAALREHILKVHRRRIDEAEALSREKDHECLKRQNISNKGKGWQDLKEKDIVPTKIGRPILEATKDYLTKLCSLDNKEEKEKLKAKYKAKLVRLGMKESEIKF